MEISTVFLDRDGVLNADDPGYVLREEDVQVLPGVPEAVKRLTDAGIGMIIVSNQQAVGKGLLSMERAEAIFRKVIAGAESAGGRITDYYYCPHLRESNCTCRKPGTGLFEKAAGDHDIALSESVFVGDGSGDAGAAEQLGIPFYLVRQGWWERTREFCEDHQIPYTLVSNLFAAAEEILKINQGKTT